jgi:hypothetical protein
MTNMIITCNFGYPNSNMGRCTAILTDQHDRYLWFWISKFEYGQVHCHTHWPTWSLLMIWISKFEYGQVYWDTQWPTWSILAILDIQIQIWTGALPYSLTNMIGTCDFGYPNLNMDRCTAILTDQHDHYLWFWISKFEYGQVTQHTHWPTWSVLMILDIQIRIWIDVKKIEKINFHIWMTKFKNGQQWESKHTTT